MQLAAAAAVASGAAADNYRLSAFGDSLMSGHGLLPQQGFVARLQHHLDDSGLEVEVINHAISGNTSADALGRISQVLDAKPDGVLLSFGGNDMLRKIEPEVTMGNLEQMIEMLKAADIDILLVGMKAPLNWGPFYKFAFDGIYDDLADDHDLPLYPFLLDGIALDPKFNLPDGIHPNGAGIEVITEAILDDVVDLIEDGS